jgi:thiamine-phosphate pyrophosphorylase
MHVQLPKAPFLYPILDTEFSVDPLIDARKIIRAGAKMLQLRAKNLGKRAIYDLATHLASICNENQVCFLINDWVDIALVTETSGVHLGQDDFPVEQARPLMEGKILGLSTHTSAQFEVANRLAIDYIAVGPVYETGTKRSSNRGLGIPGISPLIQEKLKPVVAIGGIRQENFQELLAAGVDAIALISELHRHGDIYDTVCRLLELLEEY